MTSRQFVAAALRVVAIWMGMRSLQFVLSIFMFSGDLTRSAYLMYAVLYALVAAILWTFPMTIARHILSAAPGDSPMNITSRGLIHATIIAAGLFLLVLSVPSFLKPLAFALINPDQQYPRPMSQAETIVSLAIPALQIILALVMVLKAPGLARIIMPREPEQGDHGDL